MDIYILGVGNNTPVYIDFIEACGHNVIGLLHYNNERNGENVLGYKIIDSSENFFKNNSLQGLNFAIGVGDNEIRKKISHTILELNGNIPTLIHPSAVVSKYSNISKGVCIHANSVIQAGTSIGEGTVLSYNTSLSHTSEFGKFCYIAAGATIGAYIIIEDEVFVGQSSALISGKANLIGKGAIIGAGSVVLNSVKPRGVVVGNPAREINIPK